MGYDDHVRRGYPIVLGLIVFFAIIEGSISAFLTARFNTHHNYLSTSTRDRTRFLVFVSWWTVIFFGLYILAFFKPVRALGLATSVGAHGIFIFITWIFWMAGAASITASFGGGYNCSNVGFLVPYCNQLVAEEAFAWVIWILMTFLMAWIIFHGIASSRRGDGFRGPLIDM